MSLVITSILEPGFSTEVFKISADRTSSRWYANLEWLLSTLLSLTQLEKGLLTSKPLSHRSTSESRRAHGPQNTPSSLGLYCSHRYFSSQLVLNFRLHPLAYVLGRTFGGCTWWYRLEYFSAVERLPTAL